MENSVNTPHRAMAAMLLLSTLAINGCGTKYSTSRSSQPQPRPATETPQAETTEQPAEQLIRPTTMSPPAVAVRSLPAAIALRDQAAVAATANNHSRAIGLLERALRISPADPLTFEALAQSHLAMNQPEQALQLVRRGLGLNPTDLQRTTLEALAEQCRAML